MRGDLLAQQWNGTTYRVTLSPSGRTVETKQSLPVDLECLDIVTAPGGAIIGVDYTDNKLVLAQPIDSATGLNVFDIHPWRALSSGGAPFVIGGKGFGTLANTQVTIGGIPAQLSSVSGTRIHGIVPAHPRPGPRLLDVAVTVGGQTQVLPKAFQYLAPRAADTGAQAWASISPSGTLVGASTYTAGSFKINNTSTGGQNIERVLFDLSTGAYPDNVFDPNATAGDPVGKGFTVDTSTGVGLVSHDFLSPHDGGFDQLEIVFNAFEPGDSLTFSVDIDPTSIKGAPQPGPGESGSVGGLELIGARVVVHFSDGTVRVGEVYRTPDSFTGAHTDLEFGVPVQAGLEAVGHTERQVTVSTASQKLRVGGTPGTAFSLMRMEGALFTAGAVGGGFDIDPYEANTAIAVQEYTGVIGPGGFTDVNVVLTKENSLAGYNYFRAALKDEAGRTGPCSPVIVMLLQP